MFEMEDMANALTNALIQTPLRISPGHNRPVVSLGTTLEDGFHLPPTSDLTPLTLLRREKLGGSYWAQGRLSDTRYDFIVAIGNDCTDGPTLWHSVCLNRPGETGLLVLEAKRDARAFDVAGLEYERDIDLHGPCSCAPDVFTDGLGDAAVIGSIYDCKVTICLDGADGFSLPPDVVASWLSKGVSWVDPFNNRQITFEAAVDIVDDAKRSWTKLSNVGGYWGVAWWKRKTLDRFIDFPGNIPHISRGPYATLTYAEKTGKAIAVWVSRPPAKRLRAQALAQRVPLRQLEDGFIRSAGLGSDLIPPYSIVMDERGIYFDATRASDLEHILGTTTFDKRLLDRAARLIELMAARQITKYNVTDSNSGRIELPTGTTSILIPGQVADDLSVQRGSPKLKSNIELIKAVRRHNPESYIVYRPHPDVDAGHRAGHIPDQDVLRYADRIVRGGNITRLLTQLDEIHTMTSLAGFEALIRNKKVVTYGAPFYAGWGLTIDHIPMPRRNRQLSIEALVAGTLLLYPSYIDPVTGIPCGPEVLINRLQDPDLWIPGNSVRIRRIQGKIRRTLSKTLITIGRQFS